ncbi:tRNA pseudouridine(55) synthase TruB [Candidatus Saccharibacteria bacterium]|nr:tRNA pseudouridine(55) synthase TruB [Candidatus Saccharibacteria bacterium]
MEDRVILVDKPEGISSFGVVAKVRGRLKAEFGHKVKVGHTGTLDPFATGLLILLSGKMTKKSGEFLKLDKEYVATMKLGYTSTTGDPEGQIQEYSVKSVLPPIESVLSDFIGKIVQTPPRYSAIKINGERAYKLARKGQEFEIPKREVEIYEIEVLRYEYPELEIRCHVSSGTYIRTLAEDIGERLGTGAYLTALRRTRVGKYDVKDAVKLDELVTTNS